VFLADGKADSEIERHRNKHEIGSKLLPYQWRLLLEIEKRILDKRMGKF
jgi:hypothetical protein